MTTLLWILGATLATSFLCSTLEAVFLSVSQSHIAVMRAQGRWAGEWLSRAQKKIDEPIAAILTLNTIANTMGAAMGGAVAARVFGNAWMGLFSAVLTFSVLIFAEIVPKTLGATYWATLAAPTAYVLRVMIVLMKPILVPLGMVARMVSPSTERPTISRAELDVLAEIGRREGTLDEAEWRVVTNVIHLQEVTVGEVMTPRTDMVAVPADATVTAAKEIMLDRGHLRLPVFEGSLDRIVGVILARDLWRADRDGVTHVRSITRTVPFAPASKPVEDLIPEMRRHRTKLAIVVDEFGGTAGLVTLEDLIEEIIGEIRDEHEALEPEEFRRLAGGEVQIRGDVLVREMNDFLDLGVPEDEADTVGGLVFGRVGRVGRIGDEVELEGGTLRITRMKGRRIAQVLFLPKE